MAEPRGRREHYDRRRGGRMTKCDWCNYSRLKNGKLICPFEMCWLTKTEIKEILRALSNVNVGGDL